ncbi:hypothetical protein ANK1_3600 [plant metagenome]|uniref:Uncharacterized protein n=1 Tax=plant metagenome TaxID=1297885 RepID=A0A484QF28_9ZZZZ
MASKSSMPRAHCGASRLAIRSSIAGNSRNPLAARTNDIFRRSH